ncbi:hypothetical protein V3C99_002184, partial [Haemonchus contortus]
GFVCSHCLRGSMRQEKSTEEADEVRSFSRNKTTVQIAQLSIDNVEIDMDDDILDDKPNKPSP